MRRIVRGLLGAVKIETRRPASAIAAAGGLAAGMAFAVREPSSETMAAECLAGGLLAVAALGEIPSNILDTVRSRTRESAVWAVARSVFPMAGVAVALGAAPSLAAGAVSLAAIVLAILATACTSVVVHAAGGRGSEPATAALLVAVGASAAAAAGLPALWLAAGWGVAAWGAGSLARIVASRERPTCGRGRGRTVWLWPLPSQGRLRPSMTALAMLVGIVSMAAWLVPQPPMANRYAAVAAAVFVALAVPQMTLADGIVDRLGWAAVLRPTGRSPGKGVDWPPLGRISVAHAAMFVWPLVVAGVLTVRLPGAAVAVVVSVTAVLALAAAVAAVAVLMRRSGGSAETAQATILAMGGVCCGWFSPHIAELLRVSAGSIP